MSLATVFGVMDHRPTMGPLRQDAAHTVRAFVWYGDPAAWIAASVCHETPHRQFGFTFPKILRGIFRKRMHPLLFHTTTGRLRDAFRTRLGLHAFGLLHPIWDLPTSVQHTPYINVVECST